MIGGGAAVRGSAAARGLPAALLLLGAALLAGCCGLDRAAASPLGNRDTPGAAFAYLREAFRQDLTGNQYDSFHGDFRDAQGLSETKYRLARDLRPGLFEDAAALLGRAVLESVVHGAAPRSTSGGPRAWAEVTLALPSGARGTFLLVDEPVILVATDDADLGPASPLLHPSMDGEVRIEGGRLRVSVDRALPVAPEPGSRVLRVEIHHDWLLYGIRSVEGLDALLEEVRSTAAAPGG